MGTLTAVVTDTDGLAVMAIGAVDVASLQKNTASVAITVNI